MLKYLIDPDWVIDYLFGVERVVNRINASIPGSLGLSIVSMAELYEGVFYARDPGRRRTRVAAVRRKSRHPDA